MPSTERWNKLQVSLPERKFTTTKFPLKPALMASQKDCKNRRGFWRQNYNNCKLIFFVPCLYLLLSHMLTTVKGIVNEGFWPNCVRKGIRKHIYSSNKCKTIPFMLLTHLQISFQRLFLQSFQSDGETKQNGKSYGDTIVLSYKDKTLRNTVSCQGPCPGEGLDQMTSSSPSYDSNQQIVYCFILLPKKNALGRDICCLNVHTLTRRVGSYYAGYE